MGSGQSSGRTFLGHQGPDAGISLTQTLGCPPDKNLCKAPFSVVLDRESRNAQGDGSKVTGRAQNTDFRRNRRLLPIPPFSWKLKSLEGAGNRRKTQIFAANRRFSQKTAGNRCLGSVTLCSWNGPGNVPEGLAFPKMMVFCDGFSFFWT